MVVYVYKRERENWGVRRNRGWSRNTYWQLGDERASFQGSSMLWQMRKRVERERKREKEGEEHKGEGCEGEKAT